MTAMNDADLAELNMAHALRLYVERGGELVAEIAVGEFKPAGLSAYGMVADEVRGESIAPAQWAELVDVNNVVIGVGPLLMRPTALDALFDKFRRQAADGV